MSKNKWRIVIQLKFICLAIHWLLHVVSSCTQPVQNYSSLYAYCVHVQGNEPSIAVVGHWLICKSGIMTMQCVWVCGWVIVKLGILCVCGVKSYALYILLLCEQCVCTVWLIMIYHIQSVLERYHWSHTVYITSHSMYVCVCVCVNCACVISDVNTCEVEKSSKKALWLVFTLVALLVKTTLNPYYQIRKP